MYIYWSSPGCSVGPTAAVRYPVYKADMDNNGSFQDLLWLALKKQSLHFFSLSLSTSVRAIRGGGG